MGGEGPRKVARVSEVKVSDINVVTLHDLQNSSFLMQNSSFLIEISSFLMQNSSFSPNRRRPSGCLSDHSSTKVLTFDRRIPTILVEGYLSGRLKRRSSSWSPVQWPRRPPCPRAISAASTRAGPPSRCQAILLQQNILTFDRRNHRICRGQVSRRLPVLLHRRS